MRRSCLLPLLVLLGSPPATADEVQLRNGRVLEGRVVSEAGDAVVLETGPGRIALPSSLVATIVRTGSSAIEQYEVRAASIRADDVEAWLELAAWAEEAGLETRAKQTWERVLTLAPQNTTAHAALGSIHDGSRWVREEEYYRSRGMIRVEGAWAPADHRSTDAGLRVAARVLALGSLHSSALPRVDTPSPPSPPAGVAPIPIASVAAWGIAPWGWSGPSPAPTRPAPRPAAPVATPPPPRPPAVVDRAPVHRPGRHVTSRVH